MNLFTGPIYVHAFPDVEIRELRARIIALADERDALIAERDLVRSDLFRAFDDVERVTKEIRTVRKALRYCVDGLEDVRPGWDLHDEYIAHRNARALKES